MKQFTVKLIIFLAIVLAVLKFLDIYYTRYTLANRNVCQKPDWVLDKKNEDFDLAFLGNSRVYNMMDIPLVQTITNKKSINLGITGAPYCETYLALDQFFKHKNTIKNLVIEVDLMSLNAKKVDFHIHSYNYMNLITDSTVCSIFKDNTPLYRYAMWKYIPFVRYMEFSNRYVFYKILKGGFECRTFEGLDTTGGGVFLFDQKFENGYSKNYWTIDSTDKKYLETILTMAKKKEIPVILYTAPVYSKYLTSQLNYKEVFQFVKEMADKNHIPYFNFSNTDNPLNKDRKLFFDNTHMNIEGVRKFCTALADSIKPYLK